MPPGESHVSRISKEYYVNYFNSSHRELGPPVFLYSNSLPAQPNIKHLSCNKQPLLGCVNTSRMRPSLLCLTINLYGNKVYKHNTKKLSSTEITIPTQARITIV